MGRVDSNSPPGNDQVAEAKGQRDNLPKGPEELPGRPTRLVSVDRSFARPSRWRAVVVALAVWLCVLFFASFRPIWHVWDLKTIHFGKGTFWEALFCFAANARARNLSLALSWLYKPNLEIAGSL